MRDDLLEWATKGFESEPKIFFMDQNGNRYHEAKTEKDVKWKNPGHNKDKNRPTDEVILPADMKFFIDLYENEVTPLIGQIFDKPKLAQQEPGQMLNAINDRIKARVAEEQEKMRVGEDPLVINVDLQVPIRQLLQLMIRGTSEVVRCGKDSVNEIEDPNTLAAYGMLKTQLERAKQPIIWHESLGTLVEAKAKRMKEHIAANSDPTADENLWNSDLEGFVLGRAPDPEHIKRYYDGRNAPGNMKSDQTNAPGNTQGQNAEADDVNMSDGSQNGGSSTTNEHTETSEPAPDPNASEERQNPKSGERLFSDAVKIDCKPAYVMDGGQERKIEGYVKAGWGHSLLIRMNKEDAVPALCELTAAGPFGRGALNQYQKLDNARHIKRQTDLEVLKNRSINDFCCTFIATQRNTCSRTIIGGRFTDDDKTIERHYFQSQLDPAMGKASVDGWIKQIWPELFEDDGDDIGSTESSANEPPASSTKDRTSSQKETPAQKGTSAQKKGVPTAPKQSKRQHVDENSKSQLGKWQTRGSQTLRGC